jgi:hypothetical protein
MIVFNLGLCAAQIAFVVIDELGNHSSTASALLAAVQLEPPR